MDKTGELIEIVKKYPVLYDSAHDDYKNNRIKNKLWVSIAEMLQEPDGEILKGRWKNLRDSYSKHLRSANGEESKYLDRYKTWPWVSQMSFLQPYIELIPSRTNRGVKKSKPYKKNDSNASDYQHTFKEETNSEDIQNEEPIFIDSHRMIETQPDVSQYFVENKCLNSTSHHDAMSYDETDLIFLGYSKLIKKLSRRQQAAVKYRIAKVIMDAELEEDENPPPKRLKNYESDNEN